MDLTLTYIGKAKTLM